MFSFSWQTYRKTSEKHLKIFSAPLFRCNLCGQNSQRQTLKIEFFRWNEINLSNFRTNLCLIGLQRRSLRMALSELSSHRSLSWCWRHIQSEWKIKAIFNLFFSLFDKHFSPLNFFDEHWIDIEMKKHTKMHFCLLNFLCFLLLFVSNFIERFILESMSNGGTWKKSPYIRWVWRK